MNYLKSILLGILIYIAGFILLFLGAGYGFEGIGKIRGEHETLALVITASLPLIMVFSKSLKIGFACFVLSLFIANAVFPSLDWSYGSPYPKFGQMSLNERRPVLSESADSDEPLTISGVYHGEEMGVTSKMIISGNSWYGETFMEATGALIASSAGTMDGTDIMDGYGTKIGNVGNGVAYVMINESRVRLMKE